MAAHVPKNMAFPDCSTSHYNKGLPLHYYYAWDSLGLEAFDEDHVYSCAGITWVYMSYFFILELVNHTFINLRNTYFNNIKVFVQFPNYRCYNMYMPWIYLLTDTMSITILNYTS